MNMATKKTITYAELQRKPSLTIAKPAGSQHTGTRRVWEGFFVHYAAIIVSILELATVLVIVAFHREDFANIAAVFGLAAIIALVVFKARLDLQTNTAIEDTDRPFRGAGVPKFDRSR